MSGKLYSGDPRLGYQQNAQIAAANGGQEAAMPAPVYGHSFQGVAQDDKTSMDIVASRIAMAASEVQLLTERLSTAECRLFGGGSGACEGADGPGHPMPVGHIGVMTTTLDDLFDRIQRASEITSRLLAAI
jgi:hypothetical protein